MSYLLILAIGLGTIWIARTVKEEVYGISAAITGTLITVWGFALSPASFQVGIEIIGLISIFSFCMRCWGC
ncbi:MAG: hypothetical protein AAF208_14390 [Cyanobacteria bacterium P01_A01_bin.45]